jgi:hypothetical protein
VLLLPVLQLLLALVAGRLLRLAALQRTPLGCDCLQEALVQLLLLNMLL